MASRKKHSEPFPAREKLDSRSHNFKKIFDKQKEKFDFRAEEIIHYRKVAKEVLSTDLNNRFDKIHKEHLVVSKITKEKLENRKKAYGTDSTQYHFENIKGKFYFIARNSVTKKIEKKIPYDKNLSELQHKNKLKKVISDKPFNFEKNYIIEDSEPSKEVDKRKNWTLSYNTYFRYGILIYLFKKGRKYHIIYQSADTQARSVYVSYQRIIAEFKQNILDATGITLEEWLHLSKTKNNIFVEGGLSYKRYKGMKEKDKAFKTKLDYEFIIDFESI